MSTHINPKIITWARERNGLSIEGLASRMKRASTEIELWERGLDSPSYRCLEELAYKHLKVPVAVFFLPDPPALDEPSKKFRRLPDYEIARLSYDTFQKIHMGQAYQESLRELGTSLSASKKIFRDLNPEGLTTSQLAEQTRRYLGVSIQDQFSWRSPEQAFKYWRHALEVSSVFAFKDSFKDRYVSGFCLLDPDWPIIFVNNSNSYARQTFTLVHELGHIFFQIHGVTDIDDTYLRYMNQHDKSLEIKCNRFAAQLLVPDAVFSKEIPLVEKAGLEIIPRLADKYSVSKDVILRKLLDHRVISRESYQLKTDEWTKDYIRHMKSGAGGNYYLTKLAYLGEGFARLAFARHTAGHLNEIQLANHLNMNSANLRKLQRYARW